MFTFRPAIFFTAFRFGKILFLSIWAVMGGSVYAQNKVSGGEGSPAVSSVETSSIGDTVFFDLQRSLADQLVPFDSLVQVGLRNSPALKEDDATIEGRLARYRFSKTVIYQFVYPFANYTNGNQALYSVGTFNSSDQFQLSNGYRLGLHVQIPVAELLGRRHRLREAYADYRTAVAKRETTKQQYRRELVRLYQALLTSQKMLQIRIRDEQATKVAFDIAELEFQGGKINPADFARASNLYATAQAGVVEQRGAFSQYFYELETLVGVSLSDLKK
ncbi:TolC family protein [Fibrisoma montanum]|nr:TolC family protein [Fibrisoma montanum]